MNVHNPINNLNRTKTSTNNCSRNKYVFKRNVFDTLMKNKSRCEMRTTKITDNVFHDFSVV